MLTCQRTYYHAPQSKAAQARANKVQYAGGNPPAHMAGCAVMRLHAAHFVPQSYAQLGWVSRAGMALAHARNMRKHPGQPSKWGYTIPAGRGMPAVRVAVPLLRHG